MKSIHRSTSPFEKTPAEARSRVRWLTPKLVAQIAYTERTSEGRLRHPSFLGLREDKDPGEVTMPQTDKSSGANTMKQKADGGPAQVGGVRLTSPDRVMYPEQGASKRAIAEYYLRHADAVLSHVAERPLSLVRCPAGRGEECFFQRHHNGAFPEHIHSIDLREKSRQKAAYLYVNSAEGLVALAQFGVLEMHIWGVRIDRIEQPERLVFDLDPDPSVSFTRVRDAARELRDVLQAMGLQSFPLLTGGKGIHVVVPLVRRREWPEIKDFSRLLSLKLADAAPERYVATASKQKRKGRIFIDWLRNERGATAIAPYSLRARAGAPIATPIAWQELSRIKSAAAYTLDNIDRRLGSLRSDPWPDYGKIRQSVTQAHLESLGHALK
jgi:bifunctional non-homologous end joining protein LigD